LQNEVRRPAALHQLEDSRRRNRLQQGLGESVAHQGLIGHRRRIGPVALTSQFEHIRIDPAGERRQRTRLAADRITVDDRSDFQEHRRIGIAQAHDIQQRLAFPGICDDLSIVHAVRVDPLGRHARAASEGK